MKTTSHRGFDGLKKTSKMPTVQGSKHKREKVKAESAAKETKKQKTIADQKKRQKAAKAGKEKKEKEAKEAKEKEAWRLRDVLNQGILTSPQ